MTDGDQSIDEKRVYGDRAGATTVLVAAGTGLVSVSVSGDLVGGFGVVRRGDVRDAAAGRGGVAVATDADCLVAPADADLDADGDALAATGFGPATTAGVGDAPLAADAGGRVARYDGADWEELGRVDEVRAIDGRLVATASGVCRAEPSLPTAGLADVRDVADARAGSQPFAATGDGLYRLGNGWMCVHDEPATAVSAAAGRTRAVVDGDLYAPRGDDPTAGEWRPVETPATAAVADVAVTPDATVAVATDGTFLVTVGDGWRTHPLGLRDVRRVVPRG
jgi:hypothetical protein